MSELFDKQVAIDALWKALHKYEDKTEKQFQESEDLDVGDWIKHRIFVQNMNDIDRQVILNLPPAEPKIIRCKECRHRDKFGCCKYWVGMTMGLKTTATDDDDFCSNAKRRWVTT